MLRQEGRLRLMQRYVLHFWQCALRSKLAFARVLSLPQNILHTAPTFSLLLVVLALVTFVSGSVLAENETLKAITVESKFTLTDDPANVGSIELVGLASQPNASPTLFSLTWKGDATGWFPTWNINLESNVGLIPTELLSPGSSVMKLGPITPAAGHSYKVVLSYNSQTGALDLLITDLTTTENILQGAWKVVSYTGNLYPTSNIKHEVATHAWYAPVGATWNVGTLSAGEFTPLRLMEPQNGAWLKITTATQVKGNYRLTAKQGTTQVELLQLNQPSTEMVVPIPVDKLALGASLLQLTYTEDGEMRLAEQKQVVVGKLSAWFDKLWVNQSQRTLQTALHIHSESRLSQLKLQAQAALVAQLWNPATASYSANPYDTKPIDLGGPVDIGVDEIVLPITMPLPAQPGLYRLELSLSATPDVIVELENAAKTFSTYTRTISAKSSAVAQSVNAPITKTIRIGTYNMLGFQGWPETQAAAVLGGPDDLRRLEHYAGVISKLACDILGIQEGGSVEQMRDLAIKLNSNLVAFPSSTSYPGGVFTRYPVLESRVFNQAGPQGRTAPFSRFGGAALVDIEGMPTWLVDFHAHVNDQRLRNAEAEILGRQIDSLLQVSPNMVVLGDFNSVVGTIIHQTLRQRGLINVMELSGGLLPTATDRTGKGTYAIDHIYVSKGLAQYVTGSWVVSDPGFRLQNVAGEWVHSDHLPVVVELEWP